MGLFKKKEEVPSIPKAPTLPELPKPEETPIKKDLPGLPSFPSTPKNENLNQEMVKSAVTDLPSPGEEEVHVEAPKELHVGEPAKEEPTIPPMPSPKQSISESPILPSIPISPKKIEAQPIVPPLPQPTQNEPIFVRIDKFQSSQKNMEQVKEKMEKIEAILKKIEDTRSKEETELKGWTEDMGKIKSRLAEIDKDIFDQI